MNSASKISKVLAILMLCLLSLAGTAATSQAQTPTNINIDFQPHKHGYPRGTQVTLAAHLRDCYGYPISGLRVHFHTSADNGMRQRFDATTDCNGNAYYNYTVPGVGFNNVYISSSFDGWYTQYWWGYAPSSSVWRRLPIGG